MRGKWFLAALLAAVGVLAWSGASRGGDTIRLNMTASVPAQNLVDNGQGADTIRTWHHGFGYGGGFGGHGFGFGGHHGFGWGGYGGLGYGGWGYRGLGYGGLGYGGLGYGMRGFGLGYGGLGYGMRGFGLGYGGLGYGGLGYGMRGFGLGYGGLGYGGLGYGLGYGGLGGYGLGYGGLGGYGRGFGGFYPGFGIGYGGYGLGYGGFFPCAGTTASVYTLNMPAATLGTPLPALAQPRSTELVPQMPPSDGTFPYDGGPSKPVPNMKGAPPSSTTPPSVPLEGRSVSLPKAAPKWSYPAYGETARRVTPQSDSIYLTRGEVKKSGSR